MRARCHRCQTTHELQPYRILEGDWTKPLLLCASCWRLPDHGMVNKVTLIPILRQFPETQNAALDVGRRPA